METLYKTLNESLSVNSNVADDLYELEQKINSLLEEKNRIIAMIESDMIAAKLSKVESDKFTITYIAETVRNSFDSSKFKKDHPDLYEQFIKKSDVKSYYKFKWITEGSKPEAVLE